MKNSGQAMVEFMVALFAIVLLVAGITDFIRVASERSEIFSRLRGKAGSASMSAPDAAGAAADVIKAAASPRLAVPGDASLAGDSGDFKEKKEITLSPALRKWLPPGARDSVTVGDQLWMPPLKVSGAMAQ